MKGFPTKTPLKAFVEISFPDGENNDKVSKFPYNHIKNFTFEIGGSSKCEMELYDADGIISKEVFKTSDKTGGRFATGRDIYVQWGWIDGTKKIESKRHILQVQKASARWEPHNGFTYTIEAGPGVYNVITNKSLKGTYDGKPHEAIKKIMKDACGGEELIEVKFLNNGKETSGSSFFNNDKVTQNGNNRSYDVILKEMLLKCSTESKEHIEFKFDTTANTLIIIDVANNEKNINEIYYDGSNFEFGKLPSGSKTYLMEFEYDYNALILQLSGGVAIQGVTDDFSSEEEGDTANENVGKTNNENIGKTEDAESGGVESNQGKIGSEDPKKEISNNEAKHTISVNKPIPRYDDKDLEGRDPKKLNEAISQQMQRLINKGGITGEATFIGNPKWDDTKEMHGASMHFDVYTSEPKKPGQTINKPVSFEMQVQTVIHAIQGGVYTCTLPDLTARTS